MTEKKTPPRAPDRPLECGECKKPIAVCYTEIIGDSIVRTGMCADCPELQYRLHGTHAQASSTQLTENPAGLECGNCGTTLEEVKRGHPLGCPECYTLFDDLLVAEMQTANRLPPRFSSTNKNLPLHVGRSQGESMKVNPSSRLLALDEALKETLRREDYEQAARLRDQIKALTQNPAFDPSVEDTKDDSAR